MGRAIGSMLAQSETQASAAATADATAAVAGRRRLQLAVAGNATNGTNATGPVLSAGQLAKQRAAGRAAKLVNSTASLSGTLGNGLIPGEAPSTVSSPGLSISASREDPCDLDAASNNQSNPPLENGISGSFALPPGSLCKATDPASAEGRRRLSAFRRDGGL